MAPVSLWLMASMLALATFAAMAWHVFNEISWHDLEELCLQRQRKKLFQKIFDYREPMEIGASVMQMLALAISLTSAFFWIANQGIRLEELSGRQMTAFASFVAITLIATQTWLPLAVAKFASSQFLFATWRWWRLVALVGYPFLVGQHFVSVIFARASGQEEKVPDQQEYEDEIRAIASEAEHDGDFNEQMREMLEGVMDLDDSSVTKVMMPRSRVDMLDSETPWDEVMEFVVASGRTRIPVYEGKVDNVIGILYVKDLLKETLKRRRKKRQKGRSLKTVIRKPALITKQSTKLDAMLATFLQGRMHLAIVQDEFDGLIGIVTIEDILEEIVGEIVDETDEEVQEPIRMSSSTMAEVDGSTPIDRINEKLGTQLPEEEDFATVSGLIMRELKDIPRPGQELQVGNVKFSVLESNRRSIATVQIEVLSEE